MIVPVLREERLLMARKIPTVRSVAGDASASARLRRFGEKAEIVVFESDPFPLSRNS